MRWLLALLVIVAPGAARAEVVSAGPNGFEVRQAVQVVIPKPATFDAFTRIAEWWNAEHTYSGNSSNLTLSLSPGGCFCETLPNGGGIEHLHVAYVVPGERLVMTGALGPLLYQAATGVMDIKVERIAGGSRVTLDYKVAGFANNNAEKLAPLVDQVLGDQMARFRKYAVAMPKTR